MEIHICLVGSGWLHLNVEFIREVLEMLNDNEAKYMTNEVSWATVQFTWLFKRR